MLSAPAKAKSKVSESIHGKAGSRTAALSGWAGRTCGNATFDPPFSNAMVSGSAYAESGSSGCQTAPASDAGPFLAL